VAGLFLTFPPLSLSLALTKVTLLMTDRWYFVAFLNHVTAFIVFINPRFTNLHLFAFSAVDLEQIADTRMPLPI
jgi:hypothetical protein